MRIVEVCPFFAPHAGGVESHVRRLSAQLVRDGHEVTVLTSRYDRSLPETDTIDGIRVRRGRSLGTVLNTPIDVGIGELLRTTPSDIVHLHYPPPVTPYFAARALRHDPRPSVLTYHCDLYLPGPGGRALTAVYERILLPNLLNRVSRTIVHTRSYGATSAMLNNRSTDIIPSLVDIDRFRGPFEVSALRTSLGLDGGRVVVFTGRLVPHKGFDTGLRMLALLPSDVNMLVIGAGPSLGRLVALAQRLGVSGRVRILTDVPDAELPRYFALSDVFVYPSQNRLEGFGLAIAEAMAAGLPVVIADMPGVREVIEPDREGLLAEPMIPADFARQVRRVLDDPAWARQLGEAGRHRAETRFAVKTITDQVFAVYESLLAAPRSPGR